MKVQRIKQSKEAIREETTVNTILNAVMSYLEHLSRLGFKSIDVFKRILNFEVFLFSLNQNKERRNRIVKTKRTNSKG